MPLKVGYFVRESATNLRRHPFLTVAATLTVCVSLLLLGGVLIVGDFVDGITGNITDKIEVSVFLRDDVTTDQQKDIQTTLETLPVVAKDGVEYVSKEEAFAEFKDLYRDQPVLWENIDATVLPASFRVRLTDPKRVDLVRARLKDNPGVESVEDQQAVVRRIVKFTSVLRTFSAFAVTILFVASVVLIFNTIQVAIFARRREIEIMKLVGATNWFVRVPFLFEGIAHGLLGAFVAVVGLTAAKYVARALLRDVVWIPTASLSGFDPGQIVLILAVGAGIGAVGSFLSLRKWLTV